MTQSRKSGLPPRVTGTILLHGKSAKDREFGGNVDFLTADVRKALNLPSCESESEWTDLPHLDSEIFNDVKHEAGIALAAREYTIERDRPPDEDLPYLHLNPEIFNYVKPEVYIIEPELWPEDEEPHLQNLNHDQACEEQEQEIFDEVMSEHDIGNRMAWAVREYIVASIDKVDSTQLRQEGAAAEKAINKSLALLRPPNQTLGAINRACRALAYEIGEERIDALEEIGHVLANIRSAESGQGRDANRAAHQFIAELRRIYEECTGRPPTRSNLADGSDVTGPFGRFVKAVDAQLGPFRLPDIDNLIRQEVARRRTA
jgi:hypothetical protein